MNAIRIHHELRDLLCVGCGKPVLFDSRTTSHRDAPEMIQPNSANPDAWFGLVQGDAGPVLIAVCVRDCLERIFRE